MKDATLPTVPGLYVPAHSLKWLEGARVLALDEHVGWREHDEILSAEKVREISRPWGGLVRLIPETEADQ